ncbi:MAG: tetratricopeptide repeat protein, partial [Bacteroidota bacterium]
ALFNLAFLYEQQDKPDQAEQYYLKAIEQGDVEALFNLANLYLEQDKPDQAEQYYLKAIEQGNVEALFNLAFLYEQQDKPDQAEQYYLKAIEQGDVEALFNLALLYYSINQKKKEASTLLSTLRRLVPENIKYHMLQVTILAWVGQLDNYQQEREVILDKLVRSAPQLLVQFLIALLIHDPSDYVFQAFEQGSHAPLLQEHFKPFHYAAIHFTQPEDARLKNIPEEIQKDYEGLVSHIQQGRVFYAE